MRKSTALTLGILLLLSFLFFMSPVGWYVVSSPFSRYPSSPLPPPPSTSRTFSLPEGFAVSVYAGNVPGARDLAHDSSGTLVVSLTKSGRVVALPDSDGDRTADKVVDILTGLRGPHGIAFDGTRLYVAEEDVVQSYAYDPETFSATLPRTLASLPGGGGHSTRSIIFSNDGTQLLVSIGSSCNVCEEKDARRAEVLSIDIEAGVFGEPEEYSRGLRNMVFMATHPVTGAIWGTEMGRDLLGDDTPPDEINVLRLGGHYGWPYCYGKNIQDTTFEPANPGRCQKMDPSLIDIPAHSAPLGLAFVPEEGWPEEWWYDALVAYHGSWNRSTPTGYKIVRFPLDAEGNPEDAPVDFLTGFMDGTGAVIGRPVDILLEPGGVMYVSDDEAGRIYRISRSD